MFTGDLVDRWRPGLSKQDARYKDRTASLGEEPGEELRIEGAINALAQSASHTRSLIVRLIGNHELTNRFGHDCHNVSELTLGITRSATEGRRAEACLARHERFKPKHDMGDALSRFGGIRCIFVVDGALACHGGVRPELATELHESGLHLSYANELLAKAWEGAELDEKEREWSSKLLSGDESVLWDRSLSETRPSEYVGQVFRAVRLHYPGVHTLVVGHSIQSHGVDVVETPHGRVVRVDVGMSRSFAGDREPDGGAYVKSHAQVARYEVAKNTVTRIA